MERKCNWVYEYVVTFSKTEYSMGDGTVVDCKYAYDGRKLQEKVTGPVYMFFLRDHL